MLSQFLYSFMLCNKRLCYMHDDSVLMKFMLKGHSDAELHIFLVRVESIYHRMFFYSKIVLALSRNFRPKYVGI